MESSLSDGPGCPALPRRHFLAKSATLVGTLWASSGVLLALAPGPLWALGLTALDARAGRVLLGMTRQVFPHPMLDDAVYALVVKDLDAAARSAPTRALLLEGIVQLDAEAGGDWLGLDPAGRLASVTRLAGSPFFEKVRSTAVVSLYNNELAFAHFGYEGESFSKAGYLERGFNSLTWLPAPPVDVSPPTP